MKISVNSNNFNDEVLNSEKPVLVDFFATWCGPCKMMAPILEEVSVERDDIKVCVVDIDESMDLAEKYNIMTVPTFKLFEGGEEKARAIGFMEKDAFLNTLGL